VAAAEEWIAMDEEPVQAVRRKRDASINVGLRLVKTGVADAFVSPGSTGAVMAGALFTLGRIRGYDRPAIATTLPHRHGGMLLIDAGANLEVKPQQLLEFGIMGAAYAEHVMGRKEPRVGLLNVGSEETKGSDDLQDAYKLLRRSPLNFIGNVEPTDLPSGVVDVVVTDGFSGNVLLKAAEGTASYIVGELRQLLTSKVHYKAAAMLLRSGLRKMGNTLDYSAYGGAPLLGVNGVVIICHGRSNAAAIRKAVQVAGEAASHSLVERLRELSRTKTG
jgi:glycerol-3-phosphate acyltransferase PlsX